VARCERRGGDEHLDVHGGQHPVYFAMMDAAALGDGVEVGLDSGPGVLPVPVAQLVQVIDDQDGGTAGHRELGQHLVDNGLAVELGCRGQGFGAAGSGPDRARQRKSEQLRAALARPYGQRAIRWSWPGRPAYACSSDAFPLPAGAEMIVTLPDHAIARGDQVVTVDQPSQGCACRGTNQ